MYLTFLGLYPSSGVWSEKFPLKEEKFTGPEEFLNKLNSFKIGDELIEEEGEYDLFFLNSSKAVKVTANPAPEQVEEVEYNPLTSWDDQDRDNRMLYNSIS